MIDVDPGAEQAMDLMNQGRFTEAAPLFLEAALREQARGNDMMFRAHVLVAAKAWVLAAQPNGAWSVAARALESYLAQNRQNDAVSLMHKIVAMLRERGYGEAADGISWDASRGLGALWADPNAPRLPDHCHQCGAPVRPAEVVRPTPATVACRYCGASLG